MARRLILPTLALFMALSVLTAGSVQAAPAVDPNSSNKPTPSPQTTSTSGTPEGTSTSTSSGKHGGKH